MNTSAIRLHGTESMFIIEPRRREEAKTKGKVFKMELGYLPHTHLFLGVFTDNSIQQNKLKYDAL